MPASGIAASRARKGRSAHVLHGLLRWAHLLQGLRREHARDAGAGVRHGRPARCGQAARAFSGSVLRAPDGHVPCRREGLPKVRGVRRKHHRGRGRPRRRHLRAASHLRRCTRGITPSPARCSSASPRTRWPGAGRAGPAARPRRDCASGLAERTFHGLQNKGARVRGAGSGALQGGTERNCGMRSPVAGRLLLQYALFAAVAYIRAAASRAGVPVRQACQDRPVPWPAQRHNAESGTLWERSPKRWGGGRS